ncbi:MAG: endonuclease/exonuclease/phosphatase [Planctomycetaceae bacterium]|nr:endonuclease/exonuclease/phosphatase [Planctomycetaceae bacterium]
MATLAVLGGLAFLFLRDGPIDPNAASTNQPGSAAPSWGTPAPAPSGWGQPAQPAAAPNGAAGQNVNVFRPVSSTPVMPPSAGPTIRIASFNIQVFGKTKASKPYVMYTLAEIVRQFDVVAIQEIRTQDDYHIPNFVKLINQSGSRPRKYDHLVGPRLGNTVSTEQYAFVFDTERIEMDHSSYYTVRDPDNLLHREPLVASFRTRLDPDTAFTFTLINVHTDPDVVDMELDALAEVYRVVRRAGGNEDDVIMLGDFNADDKHMGRLGQIPGIQPLVTGVFSNTRQNKLYDNLVVHQYSTTEYTGRSGIFDVQRQFNLSLDQVEQVSDHVPVWAEFSAFERDYAGRIASRRGMVR